MTVSFILLKGSSHALSYENAAFQTALDAFVIGGRKYVFAVTVILIFDNVPKVFSMPA